MANRTNARHITGMVLAGGQGRRMGGRDKGLIHLNGKPMIEHVLHRLAPQVDNLLINANRNQEQYAQFGYPVIGDDIGNYQGPLAGMAVALRHATGDYLLTTPCDSPLLPTQLAERLYQQLQHTRAGIACAHDGNRLQPVFALIHKSLLPDLLDYLHRGERKIDHWYQQHNFTSVDFSDTPEAFANINTDRERNELEALLTAGMADENAS